MNIKYPKTEIMCVLGSTVYPIYVTDDVDEVVEYLQLTNRESFLTFKAAVKKDHGNGLWYPGCNTEPCWTDWTVKRNTIKSFIKLPEPNIHIDYSNKKEYEF